MLSQISCWVNDWGTGEIALLDHNPAWLPGLAMTVPEDDWRAQSMEQINGISDEGGAPASSFIGNQGSVVSR